MELNHNEKKSSPHKSLNKYLFHIDDEKEKLEKT